MDNFEEGVEKECLSKSVKSKTYKPYSREMIPGVSSGIGIRHRHFSLPVTWKGSTMEKIVERSIDKEEKIKNDTLLSEDGSLEHVGKLKIFNKVRENKKIRYTLEGVGSFAFSMAIFTPLSIELMGGVTPPGVISSIIISSAISMFVLSITDSEIIVEKYVPDILKIEDSEVEHEKAMQHLRLVNQIEVPMEAKEKQKVLQKFK
ncbi:MAG: hypothetical protein HFH45_03795 [Bacilli bacterium]|nr:hypothetical protein [Bacilli bacterium]